MIDKVSELQKEITNLNNLFNDCWDCEADSGGNREPCPTHLDEHDAYNSLTGELRGILFERERITKIIQNSFNNTENGMGDYFDEHHEQPNEYIVLKNLRKSLLDEIGDTK